MVIGVDTSCTYCGTPVRSCTLPVVCWHCDQPEEVKKREDRAREYSERLRVEKFRLCPEYQI